jgi:hypothetical protein
MRESAEVRAIVTHETMKATIGDAITSIAADTPFTSKAIAKRSGFDAGVIELIWMPNFEKRNWVKSGPKTDDDRLTWMQTMNMRRGWEKYRDALRDVVEGAAIDVAEEARLRMHQLGLEGEWQ